MKSKEYALNIRIPANLFEDLSVRAEKEHTSKSEIARDILVRAMNSAGAYGEHVFCSLAEWRKAIRKRANGVCEKCGAEGVAAHHVIPVYQGGINALSNGIYLCQACHSAQHTDNAKDPAHELIKVGYKLPRWLVEWIREQDETAVQLIRESLVDVYGVKAPE